MRGRNSEGGSDQFCFKGAHLSILEIFNRRGLRYVLVGGQAVKYYAPKRNTEDMDVLIETSEESVDSLQESILEFCRNYLNRPDWVESAITRESLLNPKLHLPLKVAQPPIDLLAYIEGLEFETIYADKVAAIIDGLNVNFISKEHLISSKETSHAKVDIQDVILLRAHD